MPENVDHVDGDRSNNLIENLRDSTIQQNAWNRKPQSNCVSMYKGVCWKKNKNRWIARIKCNGKSKQIGSFTCEKAAAFAYDAEARKVFGEFAWLNMPEDAE